MTTYIESRNVQGSRRRPAALARLAATMPAAVIADLIGIGINSGTRWAELTGRRWADYIARHHP